MSRPSEQAQHEAPVAASGANPAAHARQPADGKASEAERRGGPRRTPSIARLDVRRTTSRAGKAWLPRRWPLLPATMLMAAAADALQARDLPPIGALALIALAAAATFCRQRLREIELRLEGRRGALVASAALAVPLALFAGGMQLWAKNGALPYESAAASLMVTAVVAAIYARRHPVMIFVGQAAIWLPSVLLSYSPIGLLALTLGLVASILATREQMEVDREEDVERQAQDRAQTRARDILADYEETGQGWFWETDRRSLLTYVSPPVAELLGYPAEGLIGRPLTILFDLEGGQEGERTLAFHLNARSAFHELAVRAAVRGGEERWWSVSGRPVYDHFDNFVGFRGSGTDLTEKRRSQEEATRLAAFDSLTGLANRAQMAEALEKILAAPQEMHRCCAVFLLDLDRFKQVNDTLGHPAGDLLLKQVAQRLERVVGESGKVGRLGGDEFKIVIPKRIDRRRLGEIAERIIHTVSQPYSINGHTAIIGTSVGIALAPADGTTNDELIRNADLALYAAKDNGRGQLHFYAREMHAEAEARSQLEKDLRDAIVQGELEMQYQPVVATATERIAGFEALMRWNHPVKGWISPSKFISIAEDSGLIPQLGEWALRTACQELAKWPEEVRCAVNVSPLQFANPNLPSLLTNAIARAGIAPSRLELEITESVFLNDDENTEAMFAALKGIGVRLALDDFGTGYSSLGYLKKAPFDKIKIDQSFVRGATQPGSRNGAIIASITSLAQNLGMDTTAEGVETLDELDLVRMHGCSHVQGYIYEKPLTAREATERLATGLAAVARGPRSARAPRQTTFRKVLLDHQGQIYTGTVRNISAQGALIEGLWNVPAGTIFRVQLGDGASVTATARWSREGRMGVEFARHAQLDRKGGTPDGGGSSANRQIGLRKAG